jgi:FixJ family two-component response regulator
VTIHIVEDDPGVSDALVLLLKSMGHQAIAYPDAETFFRQEPPGSGDTIIIDLLLPGISGVKVIRWLQHLASPPTIIAISGQPQSAIEAQFRGLQIPRLLRKPLTEDVLTQELG